MRLQNISTLDGLLKLGNDIKEGQVIAETTRQSRIDTKKQSIIDTYFPPSEAAMGATLESFVGNYIKDNNNVDQAQDLDVALMNLTGGEDTADYRILAERVEEYLKPGGEFEKKSKPSDEATDFQTRKEEREKIKGEESKKETGFATVDEWLGEHKVPLWNEINLEEKGYDTSKYEDYQIKNLQVSEWQKENKDYDFDTGLKMFVNPDLPAGHVEPRPKKYGISLKKYKRDDWIRLWGKTHNPDGTPKNEKTKTKQKDEVTVLDKPITFSVSAMQQEEDIEKLKSKTMSANQFNKKYGSGTAEDILANPKDY